MPDVRTLADAAQGGANRHIRLDAKPTRPSLADAVRIIGGLKNPVGAKFNGGKARRMIIFPEGERCPVSIMGPNGRFYSDTVATFGAVSEGRNRDRLSSAAHPRGLKFVDTSDSSMLLFPDDALDLAES